MDDNENEVHDELVGVEDEEEGEGYEVLLSCIQYP